MGHHYVPQEYLGHFAAESQRGEIWQFGLGDFGFGRGPLPIKAVAQAKSYYFDEDERRLALDVEAPARRPLNKLRDGGFITPEERAAVSAYVYSMMSRGPDSRKNRIAVLPEVFANLATETTAKIPSLVERLGIPATEIFDALETLGMEVHSDQISEKNPLVKSAHSTGIVAMAIYCMQWVIVDVSARGQLVTCDNPGVFPFGNRP